MSAEISSTNPVVKAIISGTAPPQARLAAARGILPLPQTDLLEILVHLAKSDDPELAAGAAATLDAQEAENLRAVVESDAAPPSVLAFLAEKENVPNDVREAVLTSAKTPDAAIVRFARRTKQGELLELVALNQQRLIRVPALIDAIVENPYRTAEAERRAAEIRREFFEKERGAQQIADELRARGEEAAAEFFENSEITAAATDAPQAGEMSLEDALFLAKHIEIPDSEIDDSWLSLEYIEEFYEETEEERQAIVSKIIGELKADDEISGERISMLNRIMRMSMKDRVRLAMKGDREARNILIRDSNRIVAQAVVQNPRITEYEVEKIASMRAVPEEVLRAIANNRAWARNYAIIHNLARNPRTPIGNVMSILTRLQMRDLEAMTKNRNVSDAVRKQALRITAARKGR